MRTNAYQNYLENEILSADPVKLVQLLYRGALDAIGCARDYLASGEIQARSTALTKAMNILTELVLSLDHARGGELSQNLGRVYEYTQRLLIDGNFKQLDAPLVEAERLLRTLLEAWEQSARPQPATPVIRSYRRAPSPVDYVDYEPLNCAYY